MLRFQSAFPHEDISVLRGMEGARLKGNVKIIAHQYGVGGVDAGMIARILRIRICQLSYNHAATFVEAAADIAVAAVGALPPRFHS